MLNMQQTFSFKGITILFSYKMFTSIKVSSWQKLWYKNEVNKRPWELLWLEYEIIIKSHNSLQYCGRYLLICWCKYWERQNPIEKTRTHINVELVIFDGYIYHSDHNQQSLWANFGVSSLNIIWNLWEICFRWSVMTIIVSPCWRRRSRKRWSPNSMILLPTYSQCGNVRIGTLISTMMTKKLSRAKYSRSCMKISKNFSWERSWGNSSFQRKTHWL